MSPNLKASLLMMASLAAFTFNDVAVKLTQNVLPLSQLLFVRGALASVLVFGLVWVLGPLRLRVSARDWGLIGLRCACEIGAAYFFLTALFNMPIANATAILQVLPLAVTLASALVFKERVGPWRIMAILLGFVGMLLIVRPGPDGFSLYAGYALLAVLCITLRDLATRALSSQVPSMTVTLAAAVSVTVFAGLASLGQEWEPIEPVTLGLIAAASVFIVAAYLLSVMVMRVGDVGFVAPFRYSGLLWALVLGWLIFDEWPDPITLLGAAIVVAAGVFALYRERVVSQR